MAVRRRRPDDQIPVPEKYARFARCDWPSSLTCEQALAEWAAERQAWAARHSWDDGRDSPLGDWLTMMRDRRAAWLLACCTPPVETSNGHRR